MATKFFTMKFNNGVDGDLLIGSGPDIKTGFNIIDVSGFDGSDYDLTTEDYNFDGGYVKKQRMGVRQMGIHFDYKNDDYAIHDKIMGYFTPYKPGRLTVTRKDRGITHVRSIDYEVSKLEDKQDNFFKKVEYELQLKGLNGYFEDDKWQLVALSEWAGGFSLHDETQNAYSPTSTTPAGAALDGSPFYLRHRVIGDKSIFNDGHAAAPLWITFKGPAKYPKVKNLITGKEIQILKEMAVGETLNIMTGMNNPRLYIEDSAGNQTNAYPYLTTHSDLEFFLELWDNIFHYETADANQVNEVNILYKRYFTGV